jgi:hypothetical protein
MAVIGEALDRLIGVGSLTPSAALERSILLQAADKALYAAKAGAATSRRWRAFRSFRWWREGKWSSS